MSGRYQPKDAYYRRAKREGLRARSAFKLEEIARRFRLFSPGMAALDLGAAPGGFLEIVARAAGPSGRVIGVDRVPIQPLSFPQVKTLLDDVADPTLVSRLKALAPSGFDLLVSDLAPKTTGIALTDRARSLELARTAFEMAKRLLREGGSFICKVFAGGDHGPLEAELRSRFDRFERVRPQATRQGSAELYLIGLHLKARGEGAQSGGSLAKSSSGSPASKPPSAKRGP